MYMYIQLLIVGQPMHDDQLLFGYGRCVLLVVYGTIANNHDNNRKQYKGGISFCIGLIVILVVGYGSININKSEDSTTN